MLICTRCEALAPSSGECPRCRRSLLAAAREADRDPPCLEPGARVGAYTVVKLLSRHRRRHVYVARSAHRRTIILKELCSEGLSSEDRRRELVLQHERETSVLARVRDPAIPRLHDAFVAGERRYIAIERLAGRSLWSLREGPLPEREALAIAASVARVLVRLHGASPPVYHLDLSAGNVLYRPERRGPRRARARVSVIDFGTATSPGEPRARLYTRGFTPPERRTGDMESPGADLFALGAILHFLVTGRDPGDFPPFVLPPARDLEPSVTPRTEALCLWLIQPDPRDRPASAAVALSAILGGAPVPVEDAATLWRNVQQAEDDAVRFLEKHAGARRSARGALALSRAFLARGRPDAARRALLDGVETLRGGRGSESEEPADAALLLASLAEQYLLAGDAERSLAACEEARAFGRDARIELIAARSLALAGRNDEALVVLERDGDDGSLESVDRAERHAERAACLLDAGRAGEAEDAARAALALDPLSFHAARLLDRAACDPLRLPELQARVAAVPEDASARTDLGLALIAAEERAVGERHLDEAFAALERGDPLDAAAERRLLRWRLRQLAEERQSLEEALVLADRAAARFPRAAFFPYYGGLVAFLLERAEEAAARFERLLALDASAEPDGESDGHLTGARAHFWRGRALERLGRSSEALACYERAVATAPGYTEAIERLRRLSAVETGA